MFLELLPDQIDCGIEAGECPQAQIDTLIMAVCATAVKEDVDSLQSINSLPITNLGVNHIDLQEIYLFNKISRVSAPGERAVFVVSNLRQEGGVDPCPYDEPSWWKATPGLGHNYRPQMTGSGVIIP